MCRGSRKAASGSEDAGHACADGMGPDASEGTPTAAREAEKGCCRKAVLRLLLACRGEHRGRERASIHGLSRRFA